MPGHFLLLDDVGAGGRIVFTASGTHDRDTMDGRMVCKAIEPASGGTSHATCKLCTILYAYELDRRLHDAASSVQLIAFDPGLMTETGLVRSAPALVRRFMRTRAANWLFKAPAGQWQVSRSRARGWRRSPSGRRSPPHRGKYIQYDPAIGAAQGSLEVAALASFAASAALVEDCQGAGELAPGPTPALAALLDAPTPGWSIWRRGAASASKRACSARIRASRCC